MKYKEIFKLKKMLEDAKIPFEWIPNFGYSTEELKKARSVAPDLIEHYQICYPNSNDRWISVIEGFGTYGNEQDKLEIMGGFTPLEEFEDPDRCVMGYLTARNVFKRIKNHYEKENVYEKRC